MIAIIIQAFSNEPENWSAANFPIRYITEESEHDKIVAWTWSDKHW